MARDSQRRECPDCAVDRREFLSAVGATALAAGGAALIPSRLSAAPTRTSDAETAAARLYKSLSEEQRKAVVIPWDDARRTKISANWQVTKANVGSFSEEQQKIIHEVIRGVTSEDGYERFLRQMKADRGGVENYAVGIFGSPDEDNFQFEMTGRHLTLRADGNCVPGAAFGGPIIYGHGAAGNSEGNLFFHQTRRANEVFAALDAEQRKVALLPRAPQENAVQLRDAEAQLPGIAGSALSADQRELVGKVFADILAPYREEDVAEAMACLKAGGGLEKLHMAFYQTGDLGDDGVWDVWRLESPTLVCHFRGAPHVHAYVNVATREA